MQTAQLLLKRSWKSCQHTTWTGLNLRALFICFNVSKSDFVHLFCSWEYPNKQGIGSNIISTDDSANFLSFLQTLRNQAGAQDLIISAAVSITPFVGSDGSPLTDVSAFAAVLDSIGSLLTPLNLSLFDRSHCAEIMSYDIWGPWSPTVGPNAPLNNSCAPPTDQAGSAVSAVTAWTAAGMPSNQIILGVASYGHAFSVNQGNALDASGNIQLYAPFNEDQEPPGNKWNSNAECGNPNVVGGLFDFWGLIYAGFLMNSGTAASGIDYTFDSCSQTVCASRRL
jgi:chitinase